MILPDWFYQAVLDDALVLTIDRAYFDLTGGLDRWLYRIVRKHGGRQRDGWRFDFRHLHQKSGSLSPFRRFVFELRDIIRRQPLPGYTLFMEMEVGGRMLLAFVPCGQPVDGLVLSGTPDIVPSGTPVSCYRERKQGLTHGNKSANRALNFESNILTLTCCCGSTSCGDNASPLQSAIGELIRKAAFTEDDITERSQERVSVSPKAWTGADK